MKHPDLRMSLEVVLPSSDSVHSWLGHQLEVRGIDSVVYTRYIINLLQHDYSDQIETEELWGKKVEQVKKRDRKGEHKKKSPVSDEERRKNAVLECLQSVSEQDCDIENLVDELCNRLKETKTHKECFTPLSVNVNTVDEKRENKNSVTCTQDPAQRYYAAFPALSGDDSPASISPSVCEPNIWKRNPLTGQSAGETSESKDKLSSEDGKPKNSTLSTRSETKQRPERNHPKRRSKSMTDRKENDRKTQKLDGKKKVYPKGNKPKGPQTKMQKVIEKHSNTSVHVLSWPLTAEKNMESGEISKDEQRDKAAEAEYCSKVEQIIKTLLLSGISDQPRKSSGATLETEWPEWMRAESVSPELQENYEWYTQPLNEILVTPFSKSKRLYKRYSYPPTLFFDEETDLESILGPLLSSVTSRYQFVDDVFSPPVVESDLNVSDDVVLEKQLPVNSGVLKENVLPQMKNDLADEQDDKLQVNPIGYTLPYTSPTSGQFSLFEYVDNKENLAPNIQEPLAEKLNERHVQELWQGATETGLRNEQISNSELYSVWHKGQDGEGVAMETSLADLYEISSCSTQTFDSDDGTDMSDFEGIFTFDLESDEDYVSTPVKHFHQPPTQEMSCLNLNEDMVEAASGMDVPESAFFTEELLESFNSVIESPKNSGVCSMLIDREYLTEVMQMDLQNQMDMQSPYTNLSPLCFNIWSIDEGNTESCWQSKVLLHEFLQTFDDDCRITSVPWDSVLGDRNLGWNLTPKDECEKLREKTKSGQLSQLWDVNSQRKLPWFGAFWSMPYNVSIWTSFSDCPENEHNVKSDWGQTMEPVEWEIDESEIFLSQGTIDEDAMIGVELLEELHKETSKEDIRYNFLRVGSWDKCERSVSDSDIHASWSKRDAAKQEFHRSFELIPSETSAFTDVIPSKMPHVRSAPNLKLSSLYSLPPSDYDNPKLPSVEQASAKHDSPAEHLYFSNRTHFRPIQTPVGTPHEEKLEERGDLFGEQGFSSGTLYQQFHQPGLIEEKLPMFRPKFKVQKDLDKYIQTGRSLDDDYDPKFTCKSEISICPSSTTLEELGRGKIGDIFDVTGEGEDPCGKESGFESNGEIEESVILPDEKDVDRDLDECDWTAGPTLAARFNHLYLDNSDHYLPSALSDMWKEKKTDGGTVEYSNAWSSGYDCEDVEGGKYGHCMQYLQYLPLVKHGELSFSQNSLEPSNEETELKPTLPDKAYVEWPTLLESQHEKLEPMPSDSSETVCENNAALRKPGFEMEDAAYMWNEEMSGKTINVMDPYVGPDYKRKCFEDRVYPVDNMPNSVDELSQYYLGSLSEDNKHIECPATTHELLHTHGFDVNLLPPIPIPDTAVYSCELEQQDIGGPGLVPIIPDLAVYSSDLEKQWLDPKSLPKSEWPPYLSIPDARKKINKIKTKGVSRKPCSFFLEGSCKRSDCKFSHDISTITCRFWEDGMCFKGPLCPFLHGYHIASDSDTNSVDSVEMKFELKKEEFPELKLSRQGSGKV
ncbi:hypothetical protein SNE40_017926 [Patella caerulea]|uniref:C3H1-type domain-containing protein n=1 Tax=Patella caerulea TaxID=87958 RepID=A0AAN8JC17_PATCE